MCKEPSLCILKDESEVKLYHFFIGDVAFPFLKDLMQPYSGSNSNIRFFHTVIYVSSENVERKNKLL